MLTIDSSHTIYMVSQVLRDVNLAVQVVELFSAVKRALAILNHRSYQHLFYVFDTIGSVGSRPSSVSGRPKVLNSDTTAPSTTNWSF